MSRTVSTRRKTPAERAGIADGVLIILSRARKQVSQNYLWGACHSFASRNAVELAVIQLERSGKIKIDRTKNGSNLHSILEGVTIPDGEPEAIIAARMTTADLTVREQVQQRFLEMIKADIYPSRQRIVTELGLPDRIVRTVVESLVSDGVVDEDDIPEAHSEEGLGKADAERIERRTVATLARKLGLKKPPRRWREWREEMRRRKLGLLPVVEDEEAEGD